MKLFIDNQECDIFPNSIAITKQSYDFSSGISDRFLGRSNRFTLPRTQKNIQILGRPSSLGSDNRPFEKRFSAKIQDSTILIAGIAIIEESDGEYEVQVTENSKIFFEGMKVPLRNLDFESDDFTYNITSYNALKEPTSSVWLWSGHSANENKDTEFTVLSANDNRKIRYTRPWFNIRTIIEKIFETQGWSFTNISLFSEFEAAIISSNHKQFYITSYQKTLVETVSPNGSPVILSGLDTNDFENDVTTTSTVISIQPYGTVFRLRGDVVLTSDITISISGESTPGTPDPIDVQNQVFIIDQNETEIDITTNEFKTEESGIDITITISGDGAITFDNTLLYTIIEENNLGVIDSDAIQGFLVKAHDNLPEMTQHDLIVKNFFVMFGAAFNTDSFSKKLDVFGFDQVNKFNSYDWSNKYITDTKTISSISGGYGQINYFQYNNDDITAANVGKSSFTIDNVNIQTAAVLTDLTFSASNEVVIDTYTMLDMPIYGKDADNKMVRIAEAGVRIGQYYPDIGDTFTLTEFNGLRFDALSAKYYQPLINSLKRARFVNAEFDLRRFDVIGYNFSKVIYIEQLESHFWVFNIDNYQAGSTTQCNLLKLE